MSYKHSQFPSPFSLDKETDPVQNHHPTHIPTPPNQPLKPTISNSYHLLTSKDHPSIKKLPARSISFNNNTPGSMVLVSSLGMEVEDGLPMVGVENGFLVGADRCISACDRDEDGGMVGRRVC